MRSLHSIRGKKLRSIKAAYNNTRITNFQIDVKCLSRQPLDMDLKMYLLFVYFN